MCGELVIAFTTIFFTIWIKMSRKKCYKIVPEKREKNEACLKFRNSWRAKMTKSFFAANFNDLKVNGRVLFCRGLF